MWIHQTENYFYCFDGVQPFFIQRILQDEGIPCSREGVLKKYVFVNSISKTPGSGRPTKVTTEIKRIVEEEMTRQLLSNLLWEQQFSISKSMFSSAESHSVGCSEAVLTANIFMTQQEQKAAVCWREWRQILKMLFRRMKHRFNLKCIDGFAVKREVKRQSQKPMYK